MRISASSHAGIINAATYYRDKLAPVLNTFLHTDDDQRVLNWETWLWRWKANNPANSETFLLEPCAFTVIGAMFASLGLTIAFFTCSRIGICVFMFLLLIVVGYGVWTIYRIRDIQKRFNPSPMCPPNTDVTHSAI